MCPNSALHTETPNASSTIPIWSRSFGSWKFSIERQPFAPTELQTHYDREAETWQATIAKLGFEKAYAELMTQVMIHFETPERTSALKVLDVGIGTGAMAAAFASIYDGEIDLIGMDLSLEMLQQAKKNLQHKNVTAQMVQGDVNLLPFADASFDVVLVAHVLEHMANPEPALAELCRALRPGGALLACVTRPSSVGAYIQMKWRTHRVEPAKFKSWCANIGLEDVQPLPKVSSKTVRQFSNAYIAWKPLR